MIGVLLGQQERNIRGPKLGTGGRVHGQTESDRRTGKEAGTCKEPEPMAGEWAPTEIFELERVFVVVVQELHPTPSGGYQDSDRGRWRGGENQNECPPSPGCFSPDEGGHDARRRYGTQRMASSRYLALRLPLSAGEPCGGPWDHHTSPAVPTRRQCASPGCGQRQEEEGGGMYATELLEFLRFPSREQLRNDQHSGRRNDRAAGQMIVRIGEKERDG